MNKIILWFYLSCKRQLKRPFFLFLLCLLPLGVWMLGRAEGGEEEKIAIALVTENAEWNEKVAKELTDGNHSFAFYLCETEEILKEEVMTGQAECGYVFPKDLRERLEKGNYKRAISVVTAPSTVVSRLASETVFAGLFKVYGKELLQLYSESGKAFLDFDKSSVFKEIEPLYHKYLENGSTFSFTYETSDGGVVKKDSVKAVFPVKGVLAVFLFVIGLSAAVTAGEDKKRGLFVTLPLGIRRWCIAAEVAAPVMLSWCFAFLCLILSGEKAALGKEAAALIIYAVFIVAVSCLLLAVVRNPLVLAGLIPFFVIVSLIACPVFADLSAFVPALKTLRFFLPPYYYLIM